MSCSNTICKKSEFNIILIAILPDFLLFIFYFVAFTLKENGIILFEFKLTKFSAVTRFSQFHFVFIWKFSRFSFGRIEKIWFTFTKSIPSLAFGLPFERSSISLIPGRPFPFEQSLRVLHSAAWKVCQQFSFHWTLFTLFPHFTFRIPKYFRWLKIMSKWGNNFD